ncbi:MerR family transcriptional regulator [Streptomyces sp. TR06-5]|uniref:MerR family transcriptional regulator n=1 Tax=Streptomyces sp. TR06-5 TaxID=3385976 RepID=UPI0039A3DEF0
MERSAPPPGLTTGAVARRLGVSPTTLRSWDRRYGIGPSVREEGRHRRWSPEDVTVLQEMCRLTAAGVPPAEAARAARAPAGTGSPRGVPGTRGERSGGAGGGLPLGDVRQECRGLARAAVRLDAAALGTALDTAVRDHGILAAWEEVMVPTLRAVGRKWQAAGDRYVEVEHLLSWHVSAALRSTAAATASAAPPEGTGSGPAPGPVVLACVPGELHVLPLEALFAGLGCREVPVLMFGAAVPAPALEEAVRRTGPSAVVLWSQSRSTASRPLARHLAAMTWGVRGARGRPAVVAAGPGWAGGPLPGLHRPHGLRDALELLERLALPPGADTSRAGPTGGGTGDAQ